MWKPLLLAALIAGSVFAQNPPTVFYPLPSTSVLPSSCNGSIGWVISGSGAAYTCQSGTPQLAGGGSPGGPAGGALSGTYPNPGINAAYAATHSQTYPVATPPPAGISTPYNAVTNPFVTVKYQSGAPATAVLATDTNGTVDTTHFAFSGGTPVQLGTAGSFPGDAAVIKGHVPEASPLTVTFSVSTSNFAMYVIDKSQLTSVFIDGYFIDNFQPAIQTGTAQAGAASTITLAAGASATDGQYNQCYVAITGGTGSGQVRQITGYVGSTKVATVSAAWGTNPDNTSTYQVTANASGIAVAAASGSDHYLDFSFPSYGTHHIQVISTYFMGVVIGTTDNLVAEALQPTSRLVAIGDSWLEDNSGGPNSTPTTAVSLAKGMGLQLWGDGEGGTGWVNQNGTLGRLNFADRCAPPAESWEFYFPAATGGTWTLSVMYGGTTQTTTALNWNDYAATIQTALQLLSNVGSNGIVAGYANGNAPQNNGAVTHFILLHNMPGASISINAASLTPATITPTITTWAGTFAQFVPAAVNGTVPPFVGYLQGSGNDNAGGYSAAQIQANSTYLGPILKARYPTAVIVFSGVVSNQTILGGTITSTDTGLNAAIAAGAALLAPINGIVPFIDTYTPPGIGGLAWIFGATGTVASPTSGTNNIFRSAINTGHLWTPGWDYIVSKLIYGLTGFQSLFAPQ